MSKLREAMTSAAEKRERERRDALALYAEILNRQDNPKPGDAKALEGAMAVLGVSDAEMLADLEAVAEAKRAEADLVTEDRRIEEINKVGEKSRAIDEENRAHQDRMHEIEIAWRKAGNAYDVMMNRSENAERLISTKKKERPRAFGIDAGARATG